MNKFIVTTTIYEPSEALIKFAKMEDWTLIVVGDLKTPHGKYRNYGKVIYLSPEFQEENYKELSDAIGWNCIMRRNIGFIEAYKRGADLVASIDDDNVPYETWGKNILVGRETNVNVYWNSQGVFDILQVTNHSELWHRGYPLEYCIRSETLFLGRKPRKVLIQADLWDGDPDVDAVCRKIYYPKDLELNIEDFSTSDNYAPFNSQNTFLAREVLPYYMVLPHVGRMDDIWGGYICQYLLDIRPVFGPPTVIQKRNEQSLDKNFRDEVLGYTTNTRFLRDMENWRSYLPERTLKAFDLYQKEYKINV
jgi:hypothetical protein